MMRRSQMSYTLKSKTVLVKVDDIKTQDDDGIYSQEEWQTNEPTGIVEAVADDVTFCKIGDKVFFERYSSIPTPFGKNIRMCRLEAILAIIHEG